MIVQSKKQVEFRKVTSNEEFTQVGRLRYELLVEEMNYPTPAADHVNRLVLDSLDNQAHVIAGWDEDQLVATMRINPLRDCLGDEFSFITQHLPASIPRETLSVCTKFAVAKPYRKTSLTLRMMFKAYEYGMNHGITHDAIYCYPNMAPTYHRLGYRYHRNNVFHPVLGNIAVMSFPFHDEDYLRQSRSPFYRILKSIEGTHKRNTRSNNGIEIVAPNNHIQI